MFDEDVDSYALFEMRSTGYMKSCNMQSWLEMKNIAESFPLNRIGRLKNGFAFDHAIRELMDNSGNLRMEKVALLSRPSIRQFERKCIKDRAAAEAVCPVGALFRGIPVKGTSTAFKLDGDSAFQRVII